MDFLLECIGFPPNTDFDALAQKVAEQGEPAPWRGPAGVHRQLSLGNGLELHLDREEGQEFHSLWPTFRTKQRLRVALEELRRLPDSPFDALLIGCANPPSLEPDSFEDQQYMLSTNLHDRRRIPRKLPRGHVLAISICGFALDVSYCGPNENVRDQAYLDRPRGAYLAPLGGEQDPGGCMDLSLRVREVRHLVNPISGVPVDLIEADAPGRPLQLFVSPWQLAEDNLQAPRPGWRIEGSFLFSGRVAGGLPSATERLHRNFG